MTTFPNGACDTHMHFYDSRYPAASTATIFPPDATADDYRHVRAELGLERVVVVQPTTYGLDNSCQLELAAGFGDAARLVVVIDADVSDADLDRYDAAGARGARFQMLPGGAIGWESLAPVAERISPRGWHIQLQMDGNLLPDRLDRLLALPTPIVVDPGGRFMPPPAPDSPAFAALLTLLETGRCWVKLSAPYESTHEGAPHYPAVTRLVDELVARFPERLLWATNWPHPGQVDPLTIGQLRDLTHAWLPTESLRRRILVDNPAHLYGFEPVPA